MIAKILEITQHIIALRHHINIIPPAQRIFSRYRLIVIAAHSTAAQKKGPAF